MAMDRAGRADERLELQDIIRALLRQSPAYTPSPFPSLIKGEGTEWLIRGYDSDAHSEREDRRSVGPF